MSIIEEVSWMSKSGYNDRELLEYIDKHYDEIECELNGEEYKEPKKHNSNFCIDCNMEMTIDYQKSTLVSMKCGLCECYPVYVTSVIIRCNLRGESVFIRDMIILRSY